MLPLEGIRVVDLSRVLSGPFAAMTLADLGAEVIKVEPPRGDDTRYWGPPFAGTESTYYLSANRGKKSIVLDLKTEDGVRALWKLIGRCDVAIENFRPGTLAKLGFGWEEIHRRNPRVILASISGYGQNGPAARRSGYDLIAQGKGGLMGVTGLPGAPPVKAGFSLADLGAGMWAIIGILAALRVRDRTGEGDWIDVSLFETVVAWQTSLAEAYLVTGQVGGPLGSAHPTIAPYEAMEASDGYFNLAVGNDSLWEKLLDVLDSVWEGDSWYRAPELATNPDRVRRREELIPRLNEIFRTRTRREWLALLDEAGIPAGSVNSIAEVYEHPQIAAREVLQEVEHPTIGRMRVVRSPLHFETAGLADPSPPPLLGEHTGEILGELGEDGGAKRAGQDGV